MATQAKTAYIIIGVIFTVILLILGLGIRGLPLNILGASTQSQFNTNQYSQFTLQPYFLLAALIVGICLVACYEIFFKRK